MLLRFLLSALAAAALGGEPLLPVDDASEAGDETSLSSWTDSYSEEPSKLQCLDGRVVPQFFLLGHQKCGTSSAASLLLHSGARSGAFRMHGGSEKQACAKKEIGYLEYSCKATVDTDQGRQLLSTCDGVHKPYSKWGKQVNRRSGDLKKKPKQYAKCSRWNKVCAPTSKSYKKSLSVEDWPGAPWDMAPDTVPVPGAATALHARIAHLGTSNFQFFIMVREGLSRFSSAFYMRIEEGHAGDYKKLSAHHMSAFQGIANYTLTQFPDYFAAKTYYHKGNAAKANLMTGYFQDYGRSLYSLSCSEFLYVWGKQVTIVPMMWPVRNPRKFLRAVVKSGNLKKPYVPSGIDLGNVDKNVKFPSSNERRHPPPEKELPGKQEKQFRNKHFGPDMRAFVNMLKHSKAKVMGLGELHGEEETSKEMTTTPGIPTPVSSTDQMDAADILDHLNGHMLETKEEREARLGGPDI